jgi:hypothetical protein
MTYDFTALTDLLDQCAQLRARINALVIALKRVRKDLQDMPSYSTRVWDAANYVKTHPDWSADIEAFDALLGELAIAFESHGYVVPDPEVVEPCGEVPF